MWIAAVLLAAGSQHVDAAPVAVSDSPATESVVDRAQRGEVPQSGVTDAVAVSDAAVTDAAVSDAAVTDAIPYADDAWLISTRHLGCPAWNDASIIDLDVSRYASSGEWVETTLDELLGSEPRQTVIYIHGNRVSGEDAIQRAWQAFGVLQAAPAAPPLRLIIWSWPSDQIHGQVRDVRTKGARTNIEGQYLGWFISQLDAETRVSLMGYSFGARVATGAMHVLGGGTLAGQRVPLPVVERSRIQVVLLAAALHNYWLSAGGYHEEFWNFADRLLVLYNTCDPVLRRYRYIEKRARPTALGFAGAWGLDGDCASRTEQLNVSGSVGKTHREASFFASDEVIESVQRHVLTLPLLSAPR